ncbi:hypothetical protein ALP14_200073 [Pseudomonas amygdali pv. myricae]|nr:hypothetical protein ALP18_200284 [Pseudomonas amygdali pv. myricae]RMV26659.1 hypothetical protein ALP14_200073 [Pseudomonas amygdali pv. myricae]
MKNGNFEPSNVHVTYSNDAARLRPIATLAVDSFSRRIVGCMVSLPAQGHPSGQPKQHHPK